LIDLTTPKLGMTGHAGELIDLTTPMLGMTGWRDEPDKQPPPTIVCLGGQVTNIGGRGGASTNVCTCPAGRTAQAMGASYQNTFQCIPDTVKVPPPPKIVCTGGRVRNNACVCQAGFAPVKTGATSFRCQRLAILPPTVVTPKPSVPTRVTTPQIACAGGVVRANKCYCASGKTLQNGVCTVSRAPARLR
jgi:hypothetical protein